MIILINKESLLFETMSAARMRIAVSLEIPVTWVGIRLARGEGDKLHPAVDFEVPDEHECASSKFFTQSPEWKHEVVGQVVRTAMREFHIRREGARA